MTAWIALITTLGGLLMKVLQVWKESGDAEEAAEALRDAVAVVEARKQEQTRENLDRMRRIGDDIERLLRTEYREDEADPYLRD